MARLDQFSTLCDVEFWTKKASEAALQTLTLVGVGQSATTYEAAMHNAFAHAAEALGYDLVKRTTATEAAALFLHEAA